MSSITALAPGVPGDIVAWKAILARFQRPHSWRATWQLCNTLGAYLLVWCGLYFSMAVSWWLTMPLAVLASMLLVRVFIIFHDCGHGSFVRSRAANDAIGVITGLFAFTPYHQWRSEHAVHHGTAGDLDRRGIGDVWTMTVQEYLAAGRWQRFAYRLARNPVVLFVIAPLVMFLYRQRVPARNATMRMRCSVWLTNLVLAVAVAAMCLLFGVVPYLVIQLTVLLLAGAMGIYLFYVQHQFEDAYWEQGENWDYVQAALRGSSFVKLPKVLQWFTGSIGFHHVHHLSSRIPNYYLQRCHESEPALRAVKPVTLLGCLKALGLRLWDESSKKLISFRQMRRARHAAATAAAPVDTQSR